MRFFLYFMRATIFFLCLLACFGTVACHPSSIGQANDFSYVDNAFSAEITGTLTRTVEDNYRGSPALTGESKTGIPQPFAATVVIGKPNTDGIRDMAVSFREPCSLAGLTVCLSHTATVDGQTTRRITAKRVDEAGEMVLGDSDSFASYLRFASALLPIGDVEEISPTVDGIHTVTRLADGEERALYTFTEGQTLPSRIMIRTSREVLDLTISPIEADTRGDT